MKKLNLLIIFFIVLSCDSNDENNLNCTFDSISLDNNLGITEQQMISQYSITSTGEYFQDYYIFEEPGQTEIEENRYYFTRNSLSNDDLNLERLFYSHQIEFEPSSWLCVRQWVFNTYGEPDYDTVHPDVQLVYYQWNMGEPDNNGDYQDAIILTFAQADNEDYSAHLEDEVVWFKLSFTYHSVFD